MEMPCPIQVLSHLYAQLYINIHPRKYEEIS